jgi:hypothetical protein
MPQRAVAILKSHHSENDDELRGDERLDLAQAAHPQRLHLEYKAEDEAENAEQPNRSVKQVGRQAPAETQFSGCRRRSAPLGHRGERRETACGQGKDDDLKCHCPFAVPCTRAHPY